jgi:hypothetical protein
MQGAAAATAFSCKLTSVIINPLIMLIFSAGLLVFVFGLVEFLYALNTGGDQKSGKQHMLWGIVGMFIMASAWAILQILARVTNQQIPGFNC